MNFRPPCLVFSTLLLIVALTLAGCATPSNNPQAEAAEAEDFNDPLEDTNRAIFDFNQVVDRNVLVPVAKAYRTVLPDPVRDSLRDFLRNLREPLIFANDTLQGEFERAGQTFARFTLNSTLGVGGLLDVAGRLEEARRGLVRRGMRGCGQVRPASAGLPLVALRAGRPRGGPSARPVRSRRDVRKWKPAPSPPPD